MGDTEDDAAGASSEVRAFINKMVDEATPIIAASTVALFEVAPLWWTGWITRLGGELLLPFVLDGRAVVES